MIALKAKSYTKKKPKVIVVKSNLKLKAKKPEISKTPKKEDSPLKKRDAKLETKLSSAKKETTKPKVESKPVSKKNTPKNKADN